MKVCCKGRNSIARPYGKKPLTIGVGARSQYAGLRDPIVAVARHRAITLNRPDRSTSFTRRALRTREALDAGRCSGSFSRAPTRLSAPGRTSTTERGARMLLPWRTRGELEIRDPPLAAMPQPSSPSQRRRGGAAPISRWPGPRHCGEIANSSDFRPSADPLRRQCTSRA